MANYSSFHRNIIINILFQSSGKMQGDIISKLRIMTKISYTESKPHEKKYVVAWNPLITEPPFPGMHLDIGLCRWIPDDIEDFAAKYGAEFDEVVSKYKIDSGTQKSKSPKKRNQRQISVQSEPRCTTAPSKPTQPKESKAATATEHKPFALDNPIAKEADEIPVSDPVTETSVTETHSQSMPDFSEHPTVEQPKKSRISAKKVDADFDELCRGVIHPASLGEKKPVFLPLALRDRLDDIARLSGDRRVSASHIVINIVSKWIDDNRDTLNRKISNKDFSI